MKTITFVCEEHEEFGSLGWRKEDEPNADPLGGLAVAHDVLEHIPGGDFGVGDELIAFGVMLWLRGETGNLSNPYTGRDYEAAMGSELPDIFRHHLSEGLPFPDPPHTYRLQNAWAEQAIDEILEYVREQREWGLDDIPDEEFESLLARARGYLRIGYRRALKRYQYRRIDNHALSYLFQKIEKWAQQELQQAEEGDKIYVHVNLRRCDFKGYSKKYYERWDD